MISEEMINITNFLIQKFNDDVGHNCGASEEDKEKLLSVISDLEIGHVTFDEWDVATIEFRRYTIRADL